jgi:hypothetical protein
VIHVLPSIDPAVTQILSSWTPEESALSSADSFLNGYPTLKHSYDLSDKQDTKVAMGLRKAHHHSLEHNRWTYTAYELGDCNLTLHCGKNQEGIAILICDIEVHAA